jgi:hypothetical protein
VVKRDSGAALVLAVAALAIVAGTVLIVASQMQASQITVRHDFRSTVLDSLADAALAEALAGLSLDPSFTGLPSHLYGHGEIGSAVGPAGETSRMVTATARFQRWTATISAEVDITGAPRIMRLERSIARDREPPHFVSVDDLSAE